MPVRPIGTAPVIPGFWSAPWAAAPRPDRYSTGGGGVSAPVVSGGGVASAMGWEPPSALPETVGLGVATIDRYEDPRVAPSTIAVTAFVPLATDAFPGQVLDMNAKGFHEVLPERFVLGDAGRTRAFIGVDRRPGSALDKALSAIEAKLPKNADGSRDLDAVLEWLRVNVNQKMKWAPGASFNDGRAGLEWDKSIVVPESVWGPFNSVAFEPVGHIPVDTGAEFKVVPFERYLAIGQGYCIHKALLAALILERQGFSCRLVHGAVAKGPGNTVGHSWVELPDGRILDVAWSRCEARAADSDAMFPSRFRFGGSWRFVNQTYPYLGWPS